MEIRCTECGHVGAAASVVPSDSGVELVCANCGHHNSLDVPGGTKPKEAVAPAAPEKEAKAKPKEQWLSKDALDRLIPEPGPGRRCRKCAQLLPHNDDNCARCGLNDTEAQRFAPGDAPWERPPQGREAAYEQAVLLWKSVEENASEENINKFAAFVREEELLELGIRKFRFFLAEFPNNELATNHLHELAQSFQAKMIVARARAEVRAGNIVEATTKLRQIILWVVFVIFGGILLVFLAGTLGGVL